MMGSCSIFIVIRKKMKSSKKEGSSVTSVELTDGGQNGPGSGKEGLKEVSNQSNSVAEAPCNETQDEGDDHPHYYNPNQGTYVHAQVSHELRIYVCMYM